MGLCRHGNPESNCPKCDREWNDAESIRLQEETLIEIKKQNEKFERLLRPKIKVIKKFCPHCREYKDQPSLNEVSKRKRFHRNYCPDCGAKLKFFFDGVNEWPITN